MLLNSYIPKSRITAVLFLWFLLLVGCSTLSRDPKLSSQIQHKNLAAIESLINQSNYDEALSKIDLLISANRSLPLYHLIKARILAKKNEPQAALDYLTLQIGHHPSEPGLIAARGQLLMESGFFESARDDYHEAYQRNYRTIDTLKVLADIAQNSGKLKQALDIVDEALRLNNNDHLMWFNKARLELRLLRVSESKTSILKAISLADSRLNYHQFYIEILSFLKRKNEISKYISQIYTKFPKSSWIAMQYAAVLVEEGNTPKAKEVLELALQNNSKEFLVMFQLATILAAEKKWQPSIEYFKNGLSIEPKSTWAKVQLSKIYLQTGNVTAAIQYLNQARKENTRDLFTYQTLAKIYNGQNDTFEAERIILEGLSLNDKHLPLILEYANILEKRGNYQEAIIAYEEALLLDKSNHVIIGKLANFYRLTKNHQKAFDYFQKGIELKPSASWLRAYFVELLVDQENWLLALKELKIMEEMVPDDYWVQAKKALILDELEDHDLAFEAITKAISLNPTANWLKEIEGQVLENIGKHKQAAKAFEEALIQSPDNSYLLTRLGYTQIWFDRESAVKNIKTALEMDDFDISSIELLLFLDGQAPQSWGFAENSLEYQAYNKIIHKDYNDAKKILSQLEQKSSFHTPFLKFFFNYLKRNKKNEIRLSKSEINALTSYWHLFYLGIQAQRMGNSEDAKNYYQRALNLAPDNQWIMVKLAFTHQLLNEHNQAIKLLESYVKKHAESDNIWVLLRLALNYDLAQQYANAEKVYKTILGKKPNDNIALNNLAWMYLTSKNPEMKKFDEALILAQKAVKISPTAANLDTLANAYYQKRNYNLALKTIERALDKDRQSLDDFKKTKKKILKAIQSEKK